MTQEAVITQRGIADERDEYNDDIVTTTSTIVLDGSLGNGVLLQPYRQGTEQLVGADTTVERWILYLPATVPFTENDKITIDGRDYEADDVPRKWFNPRLKRVTHVEASVNRVR